MKLLLDTHIWVWSVADPRRLSSRVRRELLDTHNELWLSPVSVWEVLALQAKKRVELAPSPRDWIGRASVQLLEAPLTREMVLAAYELPLETRDPADRFLAATAVVLGLTLVTADRALLELGNVSTLSNH